MVSISLISWQLVIRLRADSLLLVISHSSADPSSSRHILITWYVVVITRVKLLRSRIVGIFSEKLLSDLRCCKSSSPWHGRILFQAANASWQISVGLHGTQRKLLFVFLPSDSCTGAAYAVMQCLSIWCLSHSCLVSKQVNMFSNFFYHQVALAAPF